MLAFLVKDCMKQPKEMTLTELRPYMAEYLRRSAEPSQPNPAYSRLARRVVRCSPLVDVVMLAPSVARTTGRQND
jgi:hypothetical protein